MGSPGAAADALTVGAVNKQDQLAGFSSRGPVTETFAVKPEITGPGVDIVAARAAETAMGTLVDGNYTSASGTSMATPHVSGAAAILAQRHPDWTADRLKQVLVSTAKQGSFTAMRWVEGLMAGTPDGGRDHGMDARTRTFVTRTTENLLRAFAEGPAAHHRPAPRANVGELYKRGAV